MDPLSRMRTGLETGESVTASKDSNETRETACDARKRLETESICTVASLDVFNCLDTPIEIWYVEEEAQCNASVPYDDNAVAPVPKHVFCNTAYVESPNYLVFLCGDDGRSDQS